MSNSTFSSPIAVLKTAFWPGPSTATSVWLSFRSMPYFSTYSMRAGTYSLTPNNTPPALRNSTSILPSTPRSNHASQDKYIAFCGAPAHLIGIGGWLKIARPDLRPDRKSVVWGKSWSVRIDLGGHRIYKKKKLKHHNTP